MPSVAKTSRADARAAPVSRRGAMMTPRRAGEAPPSPLQQARFGMLQRKCACGGGCPRCRGGTPVQTKLAIGDPGDAFERDADRIADEVMRMPDPPVRASPALPSVQRKCAACEEEEKSKLRTKHDASGAGPSATSAPPIVHDILRAPAQPLDAETRAFMEPRFGCDFSQVRVHTDAEARQSARDVNALAYTVGRHVIFGARQYEPHTPVGRRLLAHELTHVLQQKDSADGLHAKVTVGDPEDGAEREAEIIADVVMSGTGKIDGPFHSTSGSIQRACGSGIEPTPDCQLVSDEPTGARFLFQVNCDDFELGQQAQLESFVGTVSPAATINVLGVASSDGDPAFNENLSCSRASVAAAIVAGAGGTVGSVRATGGIGAPGDRTLRAVDLEVEGGGTPTLPAATAGTPAVPTATGTTPVFPTATVVSVPPHIRGASSPSAMIPDRIPPRVDTPVAISISGAVSASNPVVLSIDGQGASNGTATIDGAATLPLETTESRTVDLQGVTQTDGNAQTVGRNAGNLRLVATQAGTRRAASNGFSVSSIPQNLRFTSVTPDISPEERGFVLVYDWDSDSGVPADLQETEQCERVESSASGIFVGQNLRTNPCSSSANPIGDIHTVGNPLAAFRGPGTLITKQTFVFRDHRSGAMDVPMTNSGFLIVRGIFENVPGPGFKILTAKAGAATTARGISSGAGTGIGLEVQDF